MTEDRTAEQLGPGPAAAVHSGDAALLTAAARFDHIRAVPSFRSCADALHEVARIAFDVPPETVSPNAAERLRTSLMASEAAAVALLPNYRSSTELAWACAAELVDLLKATPEVVDAHNADGTTLDCYEGVCIACNEFDTLARRADIRQREVARQRSALIRHAMETAAPGPHLH